MSFEIVQTGPEGAGKQPYFLRHVGANNSDKIVKSETYAHRDGAEGAYISLARDFIPVPEGDHEWSISWNDERDKGYLLIDGWIGTHQALRFVKEYPAKAKKTAAAPDEK